MTINDQCHQFVMKLVMAAVMVAITTYNTI